jgi:hypothetical protein
MCVCVCVCVCMCVVLYVGSYLSFCGRGGGLEGTRSCTGREGAMCRGTC